MVMCFVPKCNHKSDNYTCKYFRFPKDPTVRQKWIISTRRGDREPSESSRICSCHFKDGHRENGPTIFEWNIDQSFDDHLPEKKTKKARLDDRSNEDDVSDDAVPATPGPSTAPHHICSVPASVEAELYFLRQEVRQLSEKLEVASSKFNLDRVLKEDKKVMMYTGFPTASILTSLFLLFTEVEPTYVRGWKVEKLTKEEQIFITLMKLKTNAPNLDLADRWNCSESMISNIFMSWVHLLHGVLYKRLMKNVPSQSKSVPSCLSSYTPCRMILGCVELSGEEQLNPEKGRRYSGQYKRRNTLKGLVGVTPNGVVTYLSELYPGSTSDKQVVQDSKVMDIFDPGDLIISDEGFPIGDLLPPGVSHNTPFSASIQEVEKSRFITNGISHVERAIRRIKTYKILDLVSANTFPVASIIWQLCGALSNFNNPYIKEVGDLIRLSGEHDESSDNIDDDIVILNAIE